MKRCPNCQKTFDDAMRFCQTDGTPLVDDAPPADPYKTMVASKEDIQAALSSSQNEQPSAVGIGAPDDEPLEIPSAPPASSVGSEFATKLAGSDDRCKQGPIFSPDLRACEQRIFSGQADWPDGVLDRVGVELEAPVFKEAGQSLPVIERVTDVLGERRTAGDHRQLFLEPRL